MSIELLLEDLSDIDLTNINWVIVSGDEKWGELILVDKAKAYWGAYGVSKFAIEGMSKTLSEELEKTNIQVNSLDPRRMRTKMRQMVYPAENADNNPLPETKRIA